LLSLDTPARRLDKKEGEAGFQGIKKRLILFHCRFFKLKEIEKTYTLNKTTSRSESFCFTVVVSICFTTLENLFFGVRLTIERERDKN
jgi:hypothetical protein